MVIVGIRVCPMLSSLTITVTNKVSRWHLLRLCMDENAEPHYFGTKEEKPRCLDLMFLEMLRSR
jgi:hypothetical protein